MNVQFAIHRDEIYVAPMGMAKVEHEYRLLRDEALLATGQTALAGLDREGRVQPVCGRACTLLILAGTSPATPNR